MVLQFAFHKGFSRSARGLERFADSRNIPWDQSSTLHPTGLKKFRGDSFFHAAHVCRNGVHTAIVNIPALMDGKIHIGFAVCFKRSLVFTLYSACITCNTLAGRSRPGPTLAPLPCWKNFGVVGSFGVPCSSWVSHPQPPDRSQHLCAVGVDCDPPVRWPISVGWWAIRAPARALRGCECLRLSCERSWTCYSPTAWQRQFSRVVLGMTLLSSRRA